MSVFPTNRSKQVGSVPVEGSSPGAAKIDSQSLTQLSASTTMDTPEELAPTSTPSKQVGSVPVEGSGPDAAKIDQQSFAQAQRSRTGAATLNIESASTQPSPASSTSQDSSSATTVSDKATTESGQGDLSAPLSGTQFAQSSSAAETSTKKPATTLVTRFSLGTGVATPASQLQTSQISSASISSQPLNVPGGEATASKSTATSTLDVAGPSLSITPTASGNLAMAVAFNQGYKSLTFDSQCDTQDRLQMTVCINGLFASCNDAGRYTVSPCADGMQCFALPLMTEGSTGINVMCESPSKAARVLQAESPATASQVMGSTATTMVSPPVTSAPSSATAISSSFATSLDQSQTQSSNTQGIELSTTEPDGPSSTVSSNTPSDVATTADATTEPLPTASNFETQMIFSATQSTFSDAATPSTTTEQISTSEASSSTDMPLIISFPDSLPSSLPEQSEGRPGPAAQLFPAVVAVAQTSAAYAQNSVQPSPLQQAPSPTASSAANIAPGTFAEMTTLPMAKYNDNPAKGTVTVTVTTTERL
ncbi:MAG: hypothetical protein Q9215_002459 [Flavoplaca cf. flavocitrina]